MAKSEASFADISCQANTSFDRVLRSGIQWLRTPFRFAWEGCGEDYQRYQGVFRGCRRCVTMHQPGMCWDCFSYSPLHVRRWICNPFRGHLSAPCQRTRRHWKAPRRCPDNPQRQQIRNCHGRNAFLDRTRARTYRNANHRTCERAAVNNETHTKKHYQARAQGAWNLLHHHKQVWIPRFSWPISIGITIHLRNYGTKKRNHWTMRRTCSRYGQPTLTPFSGALPFQVGARLRNCNKRVRVHQQCSETRSPSIHDPCHTFHWPTVQLVVLHAVRCIVMR